MFSQFRQAVESFVPPQLVDSSGDEHASRSRSPDSSSARQSLSLSSSQLAESALSNLRKQLVTQRSSSPSPSNPVPKSRSLPEQEMKVHKSNLEERLRAKFAIGEASNSTTPSNSARVSPTPATSAPARLNNHILSPPSTPLPESPIISPIHVTDTPAITPLVHSPRPNSLPLHSLEVLPASLSSPDVQEDEKYPESNIPLPPPSPAEQHSLDEEFPCKESSDQQHNHLHAVSQASKDEPNVESLQERLKLVEQRFSDVSMSFKKLQAEKIAADTVLRELTPVESMQDTDGLREYLRNLSLKVEMSQDEIKRLNGKLTRQGERIEELRDTHRLESASQSDQIEKLRKQVDEAEALLKVSTSSMSLHEEESVKQKAEIARLQSESERSQALVKEEEEKRIKAISLLKTVRTKLVKAEKDRDDAVREITAVRERERAETEKERAERTKLQREIETVNAERERAITGLRTQFDREVAHLKERSEKEMLSIRSQLESEVITTKTAHGKEIASKNAQISTLENSVNSLSREKIVFFDQLQLRQAELESFQFHIETLQSQNTELEYQLRELHDRMSLINEDLLESRRQQDVRSQEPSTSQQEVAVMLSAVEAQYASKLSDLKKSLSVMEGERNDSEVEWSRKLRDKTKETEELRKVLDSSARTREEKESVFVSLRAEVENLRGEERAHKTQMSSLQLQMEKIRDAETSARLQLLDLNAKVGTLEQQGEESKARETQLRAANKTLRDELRKVQSSAALLEKQRNPGIGYWTSRQETNASQTRISMSSSSSDIPSQTGSPRPNSPSLTKNDEEVNLEYLRNVILQFLEHKEMRPNLVRVLSIILHFTPQETRRLVAKV